MTSPSQRCLTVCLFLCTNDKSIMPDQPTLLKNGVMLFCVTITSFLAVHLVLDELSHLAGCVPSFFSRSAGLVGFEWRW